MGKYTEQSLQPGEQVIYEAKINIVPNIVRAVVFCYTLIWPIVEIIAILIKRKTNELAVTNTRVFGKTGIISTKQMTSPLEQVQNVSVNTTFFGRLFKYSTVKITTTTGVYSFSIMNGDEFSSVVMQQTEQKKKDEMDMQAQKMAQAMVNAQPQNN